MTENDQVPDIKEDMDQDTQDFHVIIGGLLWDSSSRGGTSEIELFLTE